MSKTVTVTATVTMEVYVGEGQDPSEAGKGILESLDGYLTDYDGPWREDFMATVEDIESGDPDRLPWGGYEGPYCTKIEVTNKEIMS